MAPNDQLRSYIFMIQANPAVNGMVSIGGTKESDGRTWVACDSFIPADRREEFQSNFNLQVSLV